MAVVSSSIKWEWYHQSLKRIVVGVMLWHLQTLYSVPGQACRLIARSSPGLLSSSGVGKGNVKVTPLEVAVPLPALPDTSGGPGQQFCPHCLLQRCPRETSCSGSCLFLVLPWCFHWNVPWVPRFPWKSAVHWALVIGEITRQEYTALPGKLAQQVKTLHAQAWQPDLRLYNVTPAQPPVIIKHFLKQMKKEYI